MIASSCNYIINSSLTFVSSLRFYFHETFCAVLQKKIPYMTKQDYVEVIQYTVELLQ